MWNGFPASSVTSRGAAGAGSSTRARWSPGLFVDFAASGPGLAPGEAIGAARLAEAVTAAGLAPSPATRCCCAPAGCASGGTARPAWTAARAGPGLCRLAPGPGHRPGGADNIAVEAFRRRTGRSCRCTSRRSGTAASTSWTARPGGAGPAGGEHGHARRGPAQHRRRRGQPVRPGRHRVTRSRVSRTRRAQSTLVLKAFPARATLIPSPASPTGACMTITSRWP